MRGAITLHGFNGLQEYESTVHAVLPDAFAIGRWASVNVRCCALCLKQFLRVEIRRLRGRNDDGFFPCDLFDDAGQCFDVFRRHNNGAMDIGVQDVTLAHCHAVDFDRATY